MYLAKVRRRSISLLRKLPSPKAGCPPTPTFAVSPVQTQARQLSGAGVKGRARAALPWGEVGDDKKPFPSPSSSPSTLSWNIL